jgi:hypothetical protein
LKPIFSFLSGNTVFFSVKMEAIFKCYCQIHLWQGKRRRRRNGGSSSSSRHAWRQAAGKRENQIGRIMLDIHGAIMVWNSFPPSPTEQQAHDQDRTEYFPHPRPPKREPFLLLSRSNIQTTFEFQISNDVIYPPHEESGGGNTARSVTVRYARRAVEKGGEERQGSNNPRECRGGKRY